MSHYKRPQIDTDWGIDQAYRYSIIQRLVALRKEVPCRLGVIITESGMFYISGNQYDPLGQMDPHGNKNYYRMDELERLCSELEANPELHWLDAKNGPRTPRKSVASELKSLRVSRKSA